MFIFGLACLALFSVLSVVLGSDNPRYPGDPRMESARWTLFNIH
jgi:hypothetical protein